MIEYRKLPKGNELIGKLGLGMGGIQNTTPDEIEAVIREAVANEIISPPYIMPTANTAGNAILKP